LIPQTNGFTAKCGMIFFEEEIIFLVHRHEWCFEEEIWYDAHPLYYLFIYLQE
jgi:hypothetical protein